MAFFLVGIAIAVVTTPDPLWWKLHFSQLGTFTAFSSYVFNATLMSSGIAIVAFSLVLRRELTHHVARSGSRACSPRAVSILIGSVGVHLFFVGAIPTNTITFLHDRAASGMVLSFLVGLIVTSSMVRGIGRPLAAMCIPAAVLVLGGGTLMVIGIINLAAFEAVGFATMFTWMLLFVACLGKHAAAAARLEAAEPAESTWVECAHDTAPHRQVRLRAARSDSPASRATLTPSVSAATTSADRASADRHTASDCPQIARVVADRGTSRTGAITLTHVIGTRPTPARRIRPRTHTAARTRALTI